MRRPWFAFALAAGLAWTSWWATPAIAQDAPRLVIVSPREGSTVPPEVRVVVRLVGGAGEVPFSLLLDRDATPVEGSDGSDTPVVSPGEDAVIVLSDVVEGSHEVQAVPISSGQAQASSSVSFDVQSSGLSVPAVIIAAALIGLLIMYRRRILSPWAERYERKPPPEPEP